MQGQTARWRAENWGQGRGHPALALVRLPVPLAEEAPWGSGPRRRLKPPTPYRPTSHGGKVPNGVIIPSRIPPEIYLAVASDSDRRQARNNLGASSVPSASMASYVTG